MKKILILLGLLFFGCVQNIPPHLEYKSYCSDENPQKLIYYSTISEGEGRYNYGLHIDSTAFFDIMISPNTHECSYDEYSCRSSSSSCSYIGELDAYHNMLFVKNPDNLMQVYVVSGCFNTNNECFKLTKPYELGYKLR